MLNVHPTAALGDGVIFPIPTKTPGRSKSRAENVVGVGLKGKGQKTPFRAPVQHRKHASVDLDIKSSITITSTTTRAASIRPLGDKTPFPNRAFTNTTKAEGGEKVPLDKLPKLLETLYPTTGASAGGERTPEMMKRPSWERRTKLTPSLKKDFFQTPAVNGNPWDVSDVSIEVEEVQQEVKEEEVVDRDEMEYMPPNTLDLPFQPPFEFDLPNYSQVGKTLFDLAHSFPVNGEDEGAGDDFGSFEDLKPDWENVMLPVAEREEAVEDPFYVRAVTTRNRKGGGDLVIGMTSEVEEFLFAI